MQSSYLERNHWILELASLGNSSKRLQPVSYGAYLKPDLTSIKGKILWSGSPLPTVSTIIFSRPLIPTLVILFRQWRDNEASIKMKMWENILILSNWNVQTRNLQCYANERFQEVIHNGVRVQTHGMLRKTKQNKMC